jgi:hypothetical protein
MAATKSYENKPTVVCRELVCVDYTVLAEMSDGSVFELSTPWGCPKEQDINNSWGGWTCLTRQQLVEEARRYNSCRRQSYGAALHLDKVRRLGWDYASRGY